jgi:hypothetical protein
MEIGLNSHERGTSYPLREDDDIVRADGKLSEHEDKEPHG